MENFSQSLASVTIAGPVKFFLCLHFSKIKFTHKPLKKIKKGNS